MSDWVEHDGKKYFEASYLILANENARQHALDSKRLDWLESHVENLSRISHTPQGTLTLEYISDISCCVAKKETVEGIRAVIDAAMELNSADSTVSRPDPPCWHKRIGEGGICLDCGKKTAIQMGVPTADSTVSQKACRHAEIAYDAYRKQTGGKSLVSGDELPPFNALPQGIKDAWAAVAIALSLEVGDDRADRCENAYRD